jgi:adenylylsulfate kinase
LTGLPASGKSTITRALCELLAVRDQRPAVLESDVVRRVLTPQPTYSDLERETFYRAMVWIGQLLYQHRVPVIFDGTANRRHYRDHARTTLPNFIEVYVTTPLATCVERDPKGIYAAGRSAASDSIPGVGASYEAPLTPELALDGRADPTANATLIMALLEQRRWLAPNSPQ